MGHLPPIHGIVNNYNEDPLDILDRKNVRYALWDANFLMRLAGQGNKYKYLLIFKPELFSYRDGSKTVKISSILGRAGIVSVEHIPIGLFFESREDLLDRLIQTLDLYVNSWELAR